MASGASKDAALLLLSVINIALYFIIIVIASWAINHGIERSHESASSLTIPARVFPIYFPMGNMATGFFLILTLLAGVVGITTSFTGIQTFLQWNIPNLHAASASSFIASSLSLLAMGFACKEIDIGWTDSNLRTLEVITIIVSATQLFYTGVISVGVEEAIALQKRLAGRV